MEVAGPSLGTSNTVLHLSWIPEYVTYFCQLAQAGSMNWYPTEDVVGGVITEMDLKVYPQLWRDSVEIWLVFESPELEKVGMVLVREG